MSEFIFLRPLWLLALIPVLLLVWLVWQKQNNQHNWKKVCDPRLLKHLIIGTETTKRNIFVWVFLFYGVVSIISLAGPAWDKLPQPVFRQQSSLIILFDMSMSMLAEDIKPSRLVRARLKLLDILKQRQEGQTALIVYAGDAFIVSPLTDDTATIAQLVPSLTPVMMPGQGSRIDYAISQALALFKQGGITEGDILLLTDEVPEILAPSVTSLLNTVNFSLSILSVGTEQGAPINLGNRGFLKDTSGNIVIAKTNVKLLNQLATRNGGQFSTLSVGDSDIEKLITKNIFKSSDSEKTDSQHDAAIWNEQGPWLVLLLLPIVLVSFRRGLVFLFVIMLLPVSEPSYALSWDSLWFNQNQQAKKLFTEGKNKESAKLFQDTDWQAAANYKAGDYEKSLKLLEGKNDINSTYNRANALAKLKRYDEALKNYDDVINENPKHQDAMYNKKIVEEELKKQQKQKNKDDKNNKEQDKNEKNKDNKDGDQSKDSQESEQDSQNKDSKQNDATSQDSKSKEQPESENENKQQENTDKTNDEKNNSEQDEKKVEAEQQQAKLNEQSDTENKEQQQAVEQWLRKIPDDPAGLMRRKFKLQYQQRNNQQNSKGPSW